MCNRNAGSVATIASGNQRLTIDIYRGFSLPQVIALLNWHEASVVDDEIVGYVEGNPQGYPMCRIVADNGGQAGTSWELADSAAGCAASCSGNCSGCSGSCAGCSGGCACR